MTGEKSFLKELNSVSQGYVTFGGGRKGRINGIGKLARSGLPCLNGMLLVEGLTANLIRISQLCDPGFKVSLNKGECVITNKDHEEVIKVSRTKDNCYLWRSHLTPCKAFKGEKKSDMESDKISKGGMSDMMLKDPTRHLISTRERISMETLNHFLGY